MRTKQIFSFFNEVLSNGINEAWNNRGMSKALVKTVKTDPGKSLHITNLVHPSFKNCAGDVKISNNK